MPGKTKKKKKIRKKKEEEVADLVRCDLSVPPKEEPTLDPTISELPLSSGSICVWQLGEKCSHHAPSRVDLRCCGATVGADCKATEP